jgi:hypothetical protein
MERREVGFGVAPAREVVLQQSVPAAGRRRLAGRHREGPGPAEQQVLDEEAEQRRVVGVVVLVLRRVAIGERALRERTAVVSSASGTSNTQMPVQLRAGLSSPPSTKAIHLSSMPRGVKPTRSRSSSLGSKRRA